MFKLVSATLIIIIILTTFAPIRGDYKPTIPAKTVCLVFDDSTTSQLEAARILRGHGFVASFAVITGSMGEGGHMTWGQVQWLDSVGMDVESHSVDHMDLARYSEFEAYFHLGDVLWEMGESRAELEAHGIEPVVYVYPFGTGARSPVMQWLAGRVYQAARGASYEAEPWDGADLRYDLPTYWVNANTTIGDFAKMVSVGGGVPILVYHRIDDAVNIYDVKLSSFEAQVQWLSDNGYFTTTLRYLTTGK